MVPDAWYAVQAKPHSERRVAENLDRLSIRAFLPLIEVTRSRRSRRIVCLEPLFPGYLFVRMTRIETDPILWHSVRWTPGVRLILGAEGTPIPVPDEVVSAIQERLGDLGFVRPGLPFAPNDRVLLRHGPFAGLEAIFERQVSPAGRVRVLMQLLGAQRNVQVDAADLELARRPA